MELRLTAERLRWLKIDQVGGAVDEAAPGADLVHAVVAEAAVDLDPAAAAEAEVRVVVRVGAKADRGQDQTEAPDQGQGQNQNRQ